MASRRFLLHYLPFLLVRVDTLLSRSWMAELEARGHAVAEWRILAILHDGDGLSVREVSEMVILPQPTVSRWVDRLQQQGYVTRTDDRTDGRQTLVSITAEGRTVARDLVRLARRRLASTTADVDGATLAELERVLLALIATLESRPELGAD